MEGDLSIVISLIKGNHDIYEANPVLLDIRNMHERVWHLLRCLPYSHSRNQPAIGLADMLKLVAMEIAMAYLLVLVHNMV